MTKLAGKVRGLYSSRVNAYKFLFRLSHVYSDFDSRILSSVNSWLRSNEADVINAGGVVSNFSYDINLSSVINSSFAGLFWFDDDYSSITDIKGLVEFSDSDVVYKRTVIPEGSHASYKSRRFVSPRGRVELNDGTPTVSIGVNCPDNIVKEVSRVMGLDQFDNVRVIRDPFWDAK